jgi:RNA polymerase sigma-70 factor (ECF subfamily)
MAMDGAEIEAILARVREADADALGELLQHYRSYLTLLARLQIGRHLRGKADCADLVQETFLEAARHFAQFRGETEAELTAWLRQILAGCLSHFARRYLGTQARDVRLERAIHEDVDRSSRHIHQQLAAVQSSPSQRISRREQSVLLADALDELPDDYRDVILLRHLKGMTFPQVAEQMERTVDSVEKLWLRALASLRRTLETGT